MKNKSLISGLIILSLFILSCSGKKPTSSKTGWAYNDRDWGGFEVNLKYKGFEPVLGQKERCNIYKSSREMRLMQDMNVENNLI